MAGAIVFFSSLALLLAFLAMRAVEMRRGVRYLAAARARTDERVVAALRALYHARIPDAHKQAVKLALRATAHRGVVALIAFVRSLERGLLAAAERVRHRSFSKGVSPSSAAPASAFLGAVVEHKSDLKKAVRKLTARRAKPIAPSADAAAEGETPREPA
jgi:hypothetical protein